MPRKAFDRHKAVITENWSTYQIWLAISTMKHSGWLSTRYCKLWPWPPWEVIPLVLMGWTKNYRNMGDHDNHLPGDDNNRQLHMSWGMRCYSLIGLLKAQHYPATKTWYIHPKESSEQDSNSSHWSISILPQPLRLGTFSVVVILQIWGRATWNPSGKTHHPFCPFTFSQSRVS